MEPVLRFALMTSARGRVRRKHRKANRRRNWEQVKLAARSTNPLSGKATEVRQGEDAAELVIKDVLDFYDSPGVERPAEEQEVFRNIANVARKEQHEFQDLIAEVAVADPRRKNYLPGHGMLIEFCASEDSTVGLDTSTEYIWLGALRKIFERWWSEDREVKALLDISSARSQALISLVVCRVAHGRNGLTWASTWMGKCSQKSLRKNKRGPRRCWDAFVGLPRQCTEAEAEPSPNGPAVQVGVWRSCLRWFVTSTCIMVHVETDSVYVTTMVTILQEVARSRHMWPRCAFVPWPPVPSSKGVQACGVGGKVR